MSAEHRIESDLGVAVSIVNYGTADMVVAALPDLMEELSRIRRSHVVIVDNDSPNDDGARLEAGVAALGLGPGVEVVRSPINGGFAAGNNVAFTAFRRLDWTPDAVLLLNPDAVVEPGALLEMLRVMEAHPRAGFVGPRIVNPDGSTWVGAFHFPSLLNEVAKGLSLGVLQRAYPTVVSDTETPTRVDWVTGSATLIRREPFEAIGDMDDGYFLYFDEVDYMLQGARLGWESWHAPAARIRHAAGAATGIEHGQAREGRQPDYWFQSWARYFVKNHGLVYARLTAALKLAAMSVGWLHRSLRGRPVVVAEGFMGDFARKVLLARLTPAPASSCAASPGGRPAVAAAR